jgi:alpha-glucosidase
MLTLYRDALALRAELDALGDGPFAWIDGHGGADEVLAFHRGSQFICVVNVGGAGAAPPPDVGDGFGIALSSDRLDPDGRIPAATAVWYLAG